MKTEESCRRTTISMHPKIWQLLQANMRVKGYQNVSAYMVELVRQDARRNGTANVIKRE